MGPRTRLGRQTCDRVPHARGQRTAHTTPSLGSDHPTVYVRPVSWGPRVSPPGPGVRCNVLNTGEGTFWGGVTQGPTGLRVGFGDPRSTHLTPVIPVDGTRTPTGILWCSGPVKTGAEGAGGDDVDSRPGSYQEWTPSGVSAPPGTLLLPDRSGGSWRPGRPRALVAPLTPTTAVGRPSPDTGPETSS